MAEMSFRRRYRWLLLCAAFLAAATGWLVLRWWLGAQVHVEAVVQRDFVQSVVASGHVETPNRVSLGAQITGTVVRIPVTEGQLVKAGDVLVELEAAELRAAVRQADGAVLQAQARLRQLREVQAPVAEQSLRQAQVNLMNARAQQSRNEDLFQKGFIGEAALEDGRKVVDLADAQVRSMQQQLQTLRSTGSDFALAEAALIQAQASAEAARARTRYATIAAPADGILISRDVEVGDVVQPGKVLMTLSPAGRVQMVVDIDEKNLRLLSIGQKAVASADAYPTQRFAAELVYINPGVNAQTGAVEVKLDVPSPPPVLKQDMTVSVDIEVARHPGALLVPTGAVREAEGPTPWVLQVQGGHAVRRAVRLGLRSGGAAEMLEGLHAGDLVVAGGESVADGARVRTANVAH
jgi:HlyD family secretion protein